MPTIVTAAPRPAISIASSVPSLNCARLTDTDPRVIIAPGIPRLSRARLQTTIQTRRAGSSQGLAVSWGAGGRGRPRAVEAVRPSPRRTTPPMCRRSLGGRSAKRFIDIPAGHRGQGRRDAVGAPAGDRAKQSSRARLPDDLYFARGGPLPSATERAKGKRQRQEQGIGSFL